LHKGLEGDILLTAAICLELNSVRCLLLDRALQLNLSLVDDDQTVPAGWDHVAIALTSLIKLEVNEPGGGASNDRALYPEDLT